MFREAVLRLIRSRSLALVAFAAAAVAAACSEQLDSTVGCPTVCPQEPIPLRDTIIDAVVFDTAIAAFPATGFENFILLSNRPDTFETRAILRFDTLPNTAQQAGASDPVPITSIDTVGLVLQFIEADSVVQPGLPPFTIEVYDVSEVADTSTSALLPFFRPDRLIGSTVVTPGESFTPSAEIALPNALVLQRIVDRAPLRLGIRIVSDRSIDVRLKAQQTTAASYLSIDVFGDEFTPRTTVATQSRFPENQPFQSASLGDFVILARGAPPPTPDVLRIGGYPAGRAYFRFDLPPSITDSAIVLRATLLLNQRSFSGGPFAADSLTVYPLAFLGSTLIEDIARRLEFLSTPGILGMDSVRVVPRDGGLRELQFGPLVRRWFGTNPVDVPRVLILGTSTDGISANMIEFFSMEAAPALRPRVRITYAPRSPFGPP